MQIEAFQVRIRTRIPSSHGLEMVRFGKHHGAALIQTRQQKSQPGLCKGRRWQLCHCCHLSCSNCRTSLIRRCILMSAMLKWERGGVRLWHWCIKCDPADRRSFSWFLFSDFNSLLTTLAKHILGWHMLLCIVHLRMSFHMNHSWFLCRNTRVVTSSSGPWKCRWGPWQKGHGNSYWGNLIFLLWNLRNSSSLSSII